MAIPTNEPQSLRAGDTWKWRREDLPDYPANVWTLTYRFKNAAGGFEVVAVADGLAFAVDELAADTAATTAGVYTWAAQVSNGTEAYTVDSGQMSILPDLFGTASGDDTAALDTRSFARKALDAVEAVLSGTATYKQKRYEIAGRSLERFDPKDLMDVRDRLRAEVQAENAAAGGKDNRRAFLKFRRAGGGSRCNWPQGSQ